MLRKIAPLLFLVAPAAAEMPVCPASIETSQASTPPAGWEAWIDTTNTRHWLAGIDFYDGPPAELALLAPDDPDSPKRARWTFGRSGGRAIWMACSYTHTSVKYLRPIPDTVKRCTRVEKKGAAPVLRCE